MLALALALAACGRSPLGPFAADRSDDGGGGRVTVSHVDVVLAVDDSTSMQDEIAALQGPVFDSFPGALLAVGKGLRDFRLAVIDGCIDPPYFHDSGESGDCRFATGTNYMVSSAPTFAQEYACVMDLSTHGYQGQPDRCTGRHDDDEQPASTAAAALAQVDGPNAGFLRDDALLLLVVITDEDELPMPPVGPEQLAEELIAAKGDVDELFVLGIGGDRDCPEGPYGKAAPARTLRAMTDVFIDAGRGVWWDLCQGRLEDAFALAIETLDGG